MLAAVDEVVLAVQQALCAEYGVDRIQDIPAGVLPKLSDDGEIEPSRCYSSSWPAVRWMVWTSMVALD